MFPFIDNALHSLCGRLRSEGLEWSQQVKKHLGRCALIMPRDDLSIILGATVFPLEISPSVARCVKSWRTGDAFFNCHQQRFGSQRSRRMQLEARVDEVVSASLPRMTSLKPNTVSFSRNCSWRSWRAWHAKGYKPVTDTSVR